jgi:uncharacterized protein (DUF2384 family)
MAPLATPAARHQPEHDTGSIDEVAIKALTRIFKAWRVAAPEAAKLSGVSERTWNRMKNGTWAGSLNQDQQLRASALAGLYKGLHLYFNDTLADKWVKMPNRGPLFEGRAPIDCMIEGGLPAIIKVREYIDSVRGGM